MAAGPPPQWPSLRCRWGWHAPLKGALWNQGYYFTRCARCGVDLVRTTFSGWEAPRGQRVVWRSRAELDLTPERPTLPAAGPTLPHTGQRAPLHSAAPPPPRRRSAAPTTPSAIPDFMDDPPPIPPPPPRPRAEAPLRPPKGDRARR